MKNLILWLIFFVPALFVELFCYTTNWFVAFFVTTRERTDVVKRLDRQVLTLPRDYLPFPFYLWQTHDNAVDEWWYGLYNVNHYFESVRKWTQADYDKCWWIRYYCRVCWLYRNNAYGWLYKLFSRPKETATRVYQKNTENSKKFWFKLELFPSSFKLEAQVPLGSRFMSVNVGWKAHTEIPRLLYANRIPLFSFKKYKV